MRVRKLLTLESPDARTCGNCGEGTLYFGLAQFPKSGAARFSFLCTACPVAVALD